MRHPDHRHPHAVDLLFASSFEEWRRRSGADSALPGAPVVDDEPSRRVGWALLTRRVARTLGGGAL